MKNFEDLQIAYVAGILGQGGCERQLYFMVKALCELGCYPDVYSFDQGGYWEGPLKKLGIRVVSITEKSKFARLKTLYQYIRRGNYDYVHSQHFYTNLYVFAACLFGESKCIGSLRNDAISEVKGMGPLGWLSILLPSRIVANSYQGKANAQKFFRNSNEIFYLPNSVDTETFSPAREKREKPYFKIITVGTIWKPKRIDRVIEIANMLNQKETKNIIFEIIGDGSELENMINFAKSKGVFGKSVFFKGRSNNIINEYRQADVLLLTSDQEGTPNVVLEAMASGLPVIASRVGDIPRLVINGKTGFSTERENIQNMAEMIDLLSRSPEMCTSMGKNAREFVLYNHSQEVLSKRLTELYIQ